MSFFRNSGMQSPERRPLIQPSARSPFCTSPSQLQEVTLDQDVTTFGYSMGIRSPTALRGRSVKEFEEQLSHLRKENFNLKLRIYFLEERMGTNFQLDKESAVKKNIELMVEVESLRKELQEKQDLLCQAVKAMELEDDEHKKESQAKDEQILSLQQNVEMLEQKLQEVERLHSQEDLTDVVSELQNKVTYLEEELLKEKQNYQALEQATRSVADANDLLAQIEQKDQEINHLYNRLHEFSSKFSNTSQRTRALESELDKRNAELQEKIQEVEQKQLDFERISGEFESLKSGFEDVENAYKNEVKRTEKLKSGLMLCHSKMTEMDKNSETQKAKIRSLEAKLDAMQSEVDCRVRSSDAKKSPLKPDNAAIEKIIEENKKIKAETAEKENKILKLKAEQFKACQIIKTMIGTRTENDKELKEKRKEIAKLEEAVKELKKELREKEKQIGDFQKTNSPLHARISQMNFTAAKPATEFEKSVAENMGDSAKSAEEYQTLTVDFESQIKLLMENLTEKESQMQNILHKHDELLQELKEKEDRITDLEYELISWNSGLNKSNLSFNSEKKDDSNEKLSVFWIKEIEEKDKEIERLETELRKRTCDLQGIVNKELWEKNREIERLQKRFGAVIENKEHTITNLEKTLSNKELQLNVLKDRISELGVQIDLPTNSEVPTDSKVNLPDETKTLQEQLKSCMRERKYFMEQIEKLQQKLNSVSDSENLKRLEQLRNEYDDLRKELEKSEQLRAESNEVCGILSTRLEELARFLDSLLQQKSVLGFLGWKRNNKLRQIVNQSLDLSRALSNSLLEHPDQSLLQLTNISNLLNSTKTEQENMSEIFEPSDEGASTFSIVPSDITLTYQSHLKTSKSDKTQNNVVEEQANVIKVLREQIENLKREIELRDTEKSVENDHDLVNVLMNFPAAQNKILSPQKIVEDLMSQDKLKQALNTSSTLKNRTENQSESESWSEPDREVSQARMGLNDESLKPEGKRHSRFFQNPSTESTEDELSRTLMRTPSKRQTLLGLQEQIAELEQKLREKENEVLTAQVAYYETDNMLKEMRVESEERQREMRERLRETEEKLKVAEKEVEKYWESEKKLQEALERVRIAEKAAIVANTNLREAENKLKNMQETLANSEEKYLGRLAVMEKDCEMRIKTVEQKAENEVKNAKLALEQLKIVYQREYIKKTEADKRISEELENLKGVLNSAESKMRGMELQEVQLKKRLIDIENEHREKISALHKDLDNATLQYSETVLEKTKLANEKAELEQRVKGFDCKELELLEQVKEFEREVGEMKEMFQKQLVTLDHDKSKLEMRVSQLESLNAELRNKLIKLQTGRNEHAFSTSLPSSPSRIYELYAHNIPYRRQISDQSGYLSEDPHTNEARHFLPAENAHANEARQFSLNEQVAALGADVERHQENSSPDLGIESDQGRFSSLEASLPRPLLQTLKLTESMSNLLDGDVGRSLRDVACDNEQCCKKTREMITENFDLKRRLLRTRRALEETVTQLTIANQRKKQVEKTICKQIHKTSQVLRKAKANLDSGSETDICKK